MHISFKDMDVNADEKFNFAKTRINSDGLTECPLCHAQNHLLPWMLFPTPEK